MAKNSERVSATGPFGTSVDVGTMNLVAARKTAQGITTNRVRDAFLDLEPSHRKMLKLSGTSFVELDGRLLVIGDEALTCANLFNRDARRPMSGGIMNPGETDAQQVIALMLKQVLGPPLKPGEKCCFSVPASALDVVGSDVTYHSAVLSKILSELGYAGEAVNEAQAIVFSECASEGFSGIGISFGSGMTNVCLSFKAMSALEFSVGKGGDWVDDGAAKAMNTTRGKMCSLKESGVDIAKPSGREQEAIGFYVQTLIDYAIKGIIDHFDKVKKEILVPEPVPIVVSGGTSLAIGFMDVFKSVFEKHRSRFPVAVSEVRHARDPMTAVATGLLVVASMDDD
jgi:hypothetical protein